MQALQNFSHWVCHTQQGRLAASATLTILVGAAAAALAITLLPALTALLVTITAILVVLLILNGLMILIRNDNVEPPREIA